MNRDKALLHMIAWAIQSLFQAQKDAIEIHTDEKLSDAEKIAILKGPNGPDYRTMNLILLLKPAIEIAREEFSELGNFFEWFDERWKEIEERNILSGPCKCKGCK